ncbi:MAG TPA: hypothetical protein VFV49_02800, partial [Thermoanaerobaculia bacterium]|nr:hypothetical protein [Thermoanaerobaculia bacterium]
MYGRVQYLRRLIVAAPVWVAIILAVLASPGGLLAAPMPRVRFDQSAVPPDVPAEALIGEDFKFRVRFRNDPSQIGYAPFVDLVLDAGGANLSKPCPCDGITFVSASLISVNGGPLPLVAQQHTAACVPSTGLVSIPHPFPDVLPVLAPAGSQLVTIELPFGSFDPTQPENVIEVTVHVSQNADAGHPLNIAARGGFRYGATAADDAPPDWPVVSDVINAAPPGDQQTDSTQWVTQEQVTPTVLIVSKKYLGPEGETATGPNFPRQYELTLDIADGQMLQNVTITDHLPNNVAFLQVVSSNPACFIPTTTPVPGAAHNSPLNDLIFQCPSITGGPGIDATIVFSFFIPELDGNGNPVLPQNCAFVLSVNDVKASGLWTPIDTCDVNPVTVSSDVTAADHILTDKCLAIQKKVVDLSGGPPTHPIPGDTLQYTLEFQLSDFRTADDLIVQDLLSDGQTLVASSLTLSVTDQCGTTSGAIPTTAWTQSTPACTTGAPPPGTALDIDVSAAMIALASSGGPLRHQNGILTGGHATASPSNVPATGTITFLAVIDDAYHCPVASPHDLFVDKDDFLTNEVTIGGTTLADGSSCASIPTTAVATPQDTSSTLLLMATDFLQKTVYAVQRGGLQMCGPIPNPTPCSGVQDVLPGDLVTFRLTNTIPSEDAESVAIQDWLPLPIFAAGGGSFINSPCTTLAAGVSCLGPSNSLTVVPIYTDDPVTNSIKFDYGTFNST